MTRLAEVRRRALARLQEARRTVPPAFDAGAVAGEGAGPVLVPEPTTTDATDAADSGVPAGLHVAAAWAWRLVLLVVAGYLVLRLVGILRVVVIPVVVALLLAALLEPVAGALRRRGMNRSLAAAVVLVSGLAVVFGVLGLIVQTFISQFGDLTTQVQGGLDEVQKWLAQGPLHVSQEQLSAGIENLQQRVTSNQSSLTSGALNTATTLAEVVTGFLLVLFTLFFFLRDGEQIWRFLCRLLPRPARLPAARAGHYSWHTLVSYVRATVLVAFVDAVGIGIGLVVTGIPLAFPLAALVFLGAFVPVVGATVTGIVAILVALVAKGPITALIVLGIVIAVQQLEGHVLQPLIMGRAVALHPLAVILAIASGVVVAGIVGGLVAVPILAVVNTAVRYLVRHPEGAPTADHESPGTESTDGADTAPDGVDGSAEGELAADLDTEAGAEDGAHRDSRRSGGEASGQPDLTPTGRT